MGRPDCGDFGANRPLGFRSPSAWAEADDARIAAIVERLQLDGIAAPSTTRIGDRLSIRVAILNHRTERADLDLLLGAAEDIARRA